MPLSLRRLAWIACLLTGPVQAFDIIAHRGASGYLPEHTLEAATLAFAQQPDFIEQDVVITKDGQPVVLHDIHLETVTDVEQRFPQRARDDGRYYALDFTLAELRTLRVHERENDKGEPVFPHRYQGSVAHFTVATLQEHLELIGNLNRELGQHIGIYPEIKSPAWHRAQGVDISRIVLDVLAQYDWDSKEANSYVQCFDFNELKRIRNELGYKGKLVLLLAPNEWHESDTDFTAVTSSEGIKQVAAIVDGVGPYLPQLVDMKAFSQGKVVARQWLLDAQQKGLTVHPYTLRKDALMPGVTYEQLLGILVSQLHVDGIFTDQVPPVKAYLNAH